AGPLRPCPPLAAAAGPAPALRRLSRVRIVAGRHRGRRLVAPRGDAVRPTSDRARAALFDILEHGEPPLRGARFLDLFAGTGAVGLEAASRGAADVLLVENAREALAAARANIAALGEGARVALLAADATRLGRAAEPFDLAFLDPPYGQGLVPRTLASLAVGGWLGRGARIIAELGGHEPLAAVPGFAVDDERRYGAARLVFLRAVTISG
ncbi:MAG TPA: 16S rRNA (guanine(966)-N(2))-methyltransferase RsmD, partial [Geminicoccaceae bacterium]|nr:16S rRNA (guanine(966)-N(2))-methyltransferase RsmD [Geminicoccaceae bacterium]